MKLVAKFHDLDSFTSEEAVRRAKDLLGDFIEIKVYPSTSDPWDNIYFAIQQIITVDQLNLLFDEGPLYKSKIKELRAKILSKLEAELDEVITDNQNKVN
jgi:hypothetical protein